MRLKNTWILLTIAIVFIVYFVAIEQPRHRKELETTESSYQLTGLSREDIYSVTIERPGETLEFIREGKKWRIISPVNDVAEDASVNTLISSAVETRIERKLTGRDEEASTFGLGDTPDAKMILRTSTKDTILTIRLGSHNITKSHFYAQKDTSPDILLLPAGLRRYALWAVPEFRDKKVVDFELDDVKRFEIVSNDRELAWERDEKNRWMTIAAGDTIRGDAKEIDTILHRLRALRVKKFLSDDPDDYAIYFPGKKNEITLWLAEDRIETSVALAGKAPDSCFAKRKGNDRITLTDSAILGVFDKSYHDLRDRHLLMFDREEISTIRLETTDTTATIVRAGTDWAYANPLLGKIEQRKITALLRRIENLKYSSVIEERLDNPSGFGFSNPYLKLTLLDWPGSVADQLLCGSEGDTMGVRYVTSSSSRILAGIETTDLEALVDAFHDVRKK